MTFLPAHIREIVEQVRGALELQSEFPVNLSEMLLYAYPVTIVQIEGLSINKAHRWFEQRRLEQLVPDVPDRLLFGCVVTRSGNGTIFLDKAASAEEKRLTVAHEFGHYVIEHWLPREQAIAEIGPDIVGVLDGIRRATWGEQLTALRKHIDVQPYHHFMLRGANGQIEDMQTSRAENDADLLALELLAPYRFVLSRCDTRVYDAMQWKIATDLIAFFGLPQQVSRRYAIQLAGRFSAEPSITDRFGL